MGIELEKTKLVVEGGEIFDKIKMRKKDTIVDFLMKNPFGWGTFSRCSCCDGQLVFILLFLQLRK